MSVTSIKHLLFHPTILFITIFISVVFSFLIFNFEMYQVKFQEIGLDARYNGILYSSFMILTGIGSLSAKHLIKKLPLILSYFLLSFLILISFMIFGLYNHILLIFIAIILQQISFGSWSVMLENFILDNAPLKNLKSTFSSMNSLFVSFFRAIIIIFLSFLVEDLELNSLYLLMATVLLLFSSIYFLFRRKQ